MENNEQLFCEACGILVKPSNMCVHYTMETAVEVEVDTGTGGVEELLISLVEARPVLWDSRLSIKERPKTKKDDAWREISEALENQYAMDLLQKKWRNPRDTYIKVKADVEAYVPSGSASKKRKRVWKHYDAMHFLSDTTTPRKTVSNFKRIIELGSPDSQPSPPQSEQSGPSGSIRKESNKNGGSVEQMLLTAINQIPPPAPAPQAKINAVCLQVSNILEQLPSRKKAELEIEFLTKAYAALHEL